MIINTSPWLTQLNLKRKTSTLTENTITDVAVVGAGISGITTAYYLLHRTKLKVAILEAWKIAHGATGHNAGQVVSFFEKPFSDIVNQHGLQQAGVAQKAVLEAREEIENILEDTGINVPFYPITAYHGFASEAQVMSILEDSYLRHKLGINMEYIYIAEEFTKEVEIPIRYKGLYEVLPKDNLLSLLETADTHYVAVRSSEQGVMNSALFAEELALYLLKHFPDRFQIFENSKVEKVVLEKKEGEVHANGKTVTTKKVVLCTNGFENLHIENKEGFAVDIRFHESVEGIVGYMAGYLEPIKHPPAILAYFDKEFKYGKPYYYLTRRPFEHLKKRKYNLISIGGPEKNLPEKREYKRDEHAYGEKVLQSIQDFVAKSFKGFNKDAEYIFHWHGLMGYTTNNLRLVGEEPCNNVLLYNLGCNGVGLLSSVYGAKRISSIIKGLKVEKTPFDPQDTRCSVK